MSRMSLAVAKQVLSSDMARYVKPEPKGTNVIIIDIHSENEEETVTTPASLTLIPAGTNVRKNYKITKKGKKTIRTPMRKITTDPQRVNARFETSYSIPT